MNTVSPILPEVTGQEVTLLFCGLQRRHVVQDGCAYGPVRLFLWTLHGATCEDEGVVVHMRGGELFSGQVRDPVMELVMTRRDQVAPLTIKGVEFRKFSVLAVTVMGRYGGSRQYLRKSAYHHSCVPSSVPFTVEGCTVSQVLVLFVRRSQCAPWTGAPAMVSARASSARWTLRFCAAVYTS